MKTAVETTVKTEPKPALLECWSLVKVEKSEAVIDNSGVYTSIHYIENGLIRVDLMRSEDNEPIKSFSGSAQDIYKALTRWLLSRDIFISTEHSAYIGYELSRAMFLKMQYVQD